jgi:hypothetical protein
VRRWGALKVAVARPGQERTVAGDGALPPLPRWAWPLCWALLAVAAGLLVRLPGPAPLDPDEHAAVLYFDRLVAGDRLEDPLLSSPKPLLTVVHGLAWRAAGDWRLLEAVTVAAFALAVVCLARAAGRLGGLPAAAAAVLAVAGYGPLIIQTSHANSVVFALAGWAVALDALTRGARSPGGGADGAGPAWAVAAGALFLAALARSEGWLLLPFAAGYGAVAWWRGARRAALLLVPLAAPLVWLAHDWLLTGDPLYTIRVPGRYTDLVSGREVTPPLEWLAFVARRYVDDPLLLALAAVGVVWLLWRRAWVWLVGLGVTVAGIPALLGIEAWRGTYISLRYLHPPDVALRLAAALGAAALVTALAVRLTGRGSRAGRTVLLAGLATLVVMQVACWPLGPVDPAVDATLDRETRLSANAAAAIAVLRPVAAEPGTVVTSSGPQRVRVALELGLPLGRVRDLFLARLNAPLERALQGSAAVFHDADGDRPVRRFAPLTTTTRTRVGSVDLVPLHTDPEAGLYVHRVEEAEP